MSAELGLLIAQIFTSIFTRKLVLCLQYKLESQLAAGDKPGYLQVTRGSLHGHRKTYFIFISKREKE